MDINALLSPDDGATSNNSSAARAPEASSPSVVQRQRRPAGGKRTSSGLSQELSRSPERHISPTSNPAPSPSAYRSAVQAQQFQQQPAAIAAPNFRPLPPTSTPIQASEVQGQPRYGYVERPVVAHRPVSTPQMETLADLASMQQRQHMPRTYSADSVRQEQNQRPHIHPQQLATLSPPIARSISRQSLADITMAEAPSQTPPPRDFTSNALSDSESQRVTELLNFLAEKENSYAYGHHVELVNLLHKGFLAHVYPPADNEDAAPGGDPRSFVLLAEMRQAREAMDTRFAVGEAIWLDWLSDEMLLASSSDERIAITELCQKAVADEPASVKLWQAYANWISTNYAACHGLEGSANPKWSAEDNEMVKELFTKDLLLSVLEQAVAATQWRVDESHLWNQYAQVFQEHISQHPTEAELKSLHDLFLRRLMVPHIAWDDTRQLYWPILSRDFGDRWEARVAEVNHMAEPAKTAMGFRQDNEFKLQRAIESGDREAVHHQFVKYFKDERFRKRRSNFDYDMRCVLFERALLYEPTNTEWWLDYVDFLNTYEQSASQTLLPLIERATRHCPWSGDLWARRILRADVEQKPREEIENTKHRATNSGLLDVGGMEELVKMLQEWCSYLRRHAFAVNSTEDDVDTAEVGITMALEDVQEAGKKIYGPNFDGDPLFRLEQIQIKFYAEARRIQEARDIYQQLAARHGNSFDFWAKYYNWEIWLWGYDRIRETRRVETDDNGPNLATAVVQQALKQRNLDYPERVMDLYLNHFQQHESSVRLQVALAEAREFANKLAVKRAKEAEEAAALAAQQQEQLLAAAQVEEEITGEKRKRDDEPLTNGDSHKRARTELETIAEDERTEPSASASAQIKRDREHNTITLRNLPADVTDVEIKKFFRDVGNPPSINIAQESDGQTASATVEFTSEEDVLAAKTRNGKELRGHEVKIQSGTLSTLYVTNYPDVYDEEKIRSLFKSYGDIVSVRFPSLKYNSRRRFCYVTFLTPEMAKAAEKAMHETKLDAMHTLTALISNPDAKKQRSGPQDEGREIVVKNMDREAKESEIREHFAQYGQIERMNLIRLVNGKPTGTLFIVYSKPEDATNAVEETNDKPFRERVLKVEIAQPKGRTAAPSERARHEDVIIKKAGSVEPAGNGERRGSDVSMASSSRPADDEAYKTARERKIAIFNIPDTVNDARIRAAMEHYGPLTKIQLRREKEGAIVEFAELAAANKVRLGVDVPSLGPEARTGEVGELLARQNKKKSGSKTSGPAPAAASSSKPAFAPPQLGARGGRGGRRGGLRFKRGGGFASAPTATSGEGGEGSKKSNADFRSIFAAGKKEEGKKTDGGSDE
ncbi:putative RNA-binding protein [Pseudocercospora fuligena]|uniref:U4/U6 snRNA-associated-splicing factor PRP24 n=1 Tax=Pseudocercospora fuligena TaxID=685502 RepID=A0A8H6RDD1_9PEZI|nr:putative RNA-binding protein [Pseudocercospora fuligena]